MKEKPKQNKEYNPNKQTKYMKQKLVEFEGDRFIIIFEDFSVVNRAN
jgi:hypothetical protein